MVVFSSLLMLCAVCQPTCVRVCRARGQAELDRGCRDVSQETRCEILPLTCVISQVTVSQTGLQWNGCSLYTLAIDLFVLSFGFKHLIWSILIRLFVSLRSRILRRNKWTEKDRCLFGYPPVALLWPLSLIALELLWCCLISLAWPQARERG